MKTLNLLRLKQPLTIATPNTAQLLLTSPATSVMHDFEVSAPLLIEASTLVRDAALIMQRAHVHFKLVLDDADLLVGTLNYNQVSLQCQMIKKAEGYDVDSLTVVDVMTSIDAQSALEYDEVKKSTIGHVLNTLATDGLQHSLVIDSHTNTIRGVINAENLARQINAPIQLRRKPNFGELFKELHVN
ncbi:hypothetical protein QWY82_14750 [Simiduia curdlanivorans]|uniref:CBS domain-containing protein n=1 Tax=Simiduia curdlanivorans TaxID=1492769 RepID=A0ABV8V1R7_9GAMM|nr:hypothetical protein [Simiduia curdlanivorans]MDN3640057.1 hypothetical protein [Simiduia curdlanivorans]